MKRVLTIIGFMLLSMLIGYGIGMAINHFIGGADGDGSVDKMKLFYGVIILPTSTLIHNLAKLTRHWQLWKELAIDDR